jgi:hypothetical protein
MPLEEKQSHRGVHKTKENLHLISWLHLHKHQYLSSQWLLVQIDFIGDYEYQHLQNHCPKIHLHP